MAVPTFDFLCKFDSLRICQGLLLLFNAFEIQDLAHEFNNGLGFVKCSGWYCLRNRKNSKIDGNILLQYNTHKIWQNLPSMLSIIFQRDGRTDWWKPNHTSLPPPRGLEHPSEGVKKERPTGVYLQQTLRLYSQMSKHTLTRSWKYIFITVLFVTWRTLNTVYSTLNMYSKVCTMHKVTQSVSKVRDVQ